MATIVVFSNWRQSREPETAASRAMTVGELIDYLGQYPEDAKVVLEGYDCNLYSGLTDETIEEYEGAEE